MKYSITPAFKMQLTTYISYYHYPATKLGDDLGFGTSYINQLLKDRTKSISSERLEQISEAIARKAVEYKANTNLENSAEDIESTKQEILSVLIQTVHPDYIVDSLGHGTAASKTLDPSLYVTNVSPQTNFQLSSTVQELIENKIELSFSEQVKKWKEEMDNITRQAESIEKLLESINQLPDSKEKMPSFNTPSTALKIVENTLKRLPDEEQKSFCSALSDLIKKYSH